MDRRGWIVVLILAAALGAALLIWSGQERSHDDGPARLGSLEAGSASSNDDDPEVTEPGRARAAARIVDAGVLAQVPIGPRPPLEPGDRPEDPPQAALDAQRSAGWRLGQARRQVELLQDRVARLEENAQRLESAGEADLATRQRTILERLRDRLTETQEGLSGLEAEAQRDGTMGDVQRGFEESEPEAAPAAQGVMPPAPPTP